MLEKNALFHCLYLSAAAALWLLLILKFLFCWAQARQELQNPLTFSVLEAFFMTLLQFSAALSVICYRVAFIFWVIANAGHIILVLTFSLRFLRKFQLNDVFATWNVLYGGNMLAAVVAPHFQMQHTAQYIFWIGFLLFLPWYFIAAYRYHKLPVEPSALPTLCIFAAPFNLSLTAYLSCTAHPNFMLAALFICLGQGAYFFVLYHLPKILRLPFYPSYGALTFPFVIPAVALQKFISICNLPNAKLIAVCNGLILAEQLIAVVMVTYALIRYTQFFLKNVRL